MLQHDACSLQDGIIECIKAVLEELRPAILQDGGDIHFVRFEDGTVYVSLHGACSTCPISFMTLTMGLENQMKQRIPEVKRVATIENE